MNRLIRFGRNLLSLDRPSYFNKGKYSKPRNTVPPSIGGATTTVGSVMTGDPGQWVDVGPLTFLWTLAGVQVGTGVSYTVVAGDEGKTLYLSVGSINTSGGASATSAGRVLG